METTSVKTLKNNLSNLTVSALKDENFIIDYPYLADFLNRINDDFPEINLVIGQEELYSMVIAKYIETYQQYITNKTVGDFNQESLKELFHKTLNEELTVSYYGEVQNIIETYYPDLYEELQKNSKQDRITIYSSLAAEVYKEINGNNVSKFIYIPPYADGYNDREHNLIREVLSSMINKMYTDEE